MKKILNTETYMLGRSNTDNRLQGLHDSPIRWGLACSGDVECDGAKVIGGKRNKCRLLEQKGKWLVSCETARFSNQ